MFDLTDDVSQFIAIGCVVSAIAPFLALTVAGLLLRQMRALGWIGDDQ